VWGRSCRPDHLRRSVPYQNYLQVVLPLEPISVPGVYPGVNHHAWREVIYREAIRLCGRVRGRMAVDPTPLSEPISKNTHPSFGAATDADLFRDENLECRGGRDTENPCVRSQSGRKMSCACLVRLPGIEALRSFDRPRSSDGLLLTEASSVTAAHHHPFLRS